MRKRKVYFDERQQIERGKAYRNAFATMLLSLLICVLINVISGTSVLDHWAMLVIPLGLSAAVFRTTLIVRDAVHVKIEKDNADTWLVFSILFVISGLFGIFFIAMSVVRNDVLVDGVLNPMCLCMFQLICMGEIGAVEIVKYINNRRKAKAAEES